PDPLRRRGRRGRAPLGEPGGLLRSHCGTEGRGAVLAGRRLPPAPKFHRGPGPRDLLRTEEPVLVEGGRRALHEWGASHRHRQDRPPGHRLHGRLLRGHGGTVAGGGGSGVGGTGHRGSGGGPALPGAPGPRPAVRVRAPDRAGRGGPRGPHDGGVRSRGGGSHRRGLLRLPRGPRPSCDRLGHPIPTRHAGIPLPAERRPGARRERAGHRLLMPAREFLLPDLGEGLDEAEVVAWRVSQGDTVELNQTLVEVNTAKALVEIPSPWEGVVDKLHAAEGDVVKVGQPLVTIQVEGAEEPEARPKRRAMLVGYGVEEEEEKEQGPPPARVPAAARGDGRAAPVPASPPVRRLAKEMGVELAAVAGTGPGGRVTREDVLAAASGAGPALEPGDERIPVRGVRRLTAEKMARSAREIPHVTTFLTVDAINLEAFRQELQQEPGSRIAAL